ncbi:Replication factor C, subunit RFC4 [Basidiobolus ranarum]|uniref:Replication factor C, subunit RFC4 n=1 Tax=Basidiobolus ranarum TaxID=34480 RepID=A0ABR2VT65_9FUNG
MSSDLKLEGYRDSAVKGAAAGGLAGLAIGGIGLLLSPKFAPKLNTLSVPLKAFWVGSAVIAGAVINGERAYHTFDRHVRASIPSKHMAPILHEHVVTQSEPAPSMSEFIAEHRYSIIGGTWAIGMSISMLYLSRQKYMTFTQKLVQARMYAQAITIIALTATAGVSMTTKREDVKPATDVYVEKKPWK